MGDNKDKTPSVMLLDQFSERDLTSWKKFSDDHEEYQVRLFYHLEGLRALHHEELCSVLRQSKAKRLEANGWWRIVDALYNTTPLSAKGSIVEGGRFNLGRDLSTYSSFAPFPALYVAETHDTAYAEKFGVTQEDGNFLAHEFALRDFNSYSAYKINLCLDNLFDISDSKTLTAFVRIISKFEIPFDLLRLRKKLNLSGKKLITQGDELKNSLLDVNWRHFPKQYDLPANSQIFGRLLKNAGFEGIIYPSTKYKGKNCVAVFLENLEKSDSWLELADPVAQEVKYIRADLNTWKELY